MSFADQIINDSPNKYEGILQNKILTANIKLKINEYNSLQGTYDNLIRNEIKNAKPTKGGWKRTNKKSVTNISAGGKDWVWGVSSDNKIYTCKKPCDDNKWEKIAGPRLTQISGGQDEVWGVNVNNEVYKMNQDHSNDWVNVPGQLNNISQGGGWVWGVNTSGNVYKCQSPCDGTWVMDTLPVTDGGDDDWILVFRQTTNNWKWSESNSGNRNIDNPDWNNYSQLKNLENYRSSDGKFTFKMSYPKNNKLTSPQIWKQTPNPYTVKNNRNGQVDGYEEIDVPYTGSYWGGLRWNGDKSILSGSTNNNWWYAIGGFKPFNDLIPGADGTIVDKTELYVKNIKPISMSQISCNDTYVYGIDTSNKVWFKPVDGSGSWKRFGNPNTWNIKMINATSSNVYIVTSKNSNIYKTDINGTQNWNMLTPSDVKDITGDFATVSSDTQNNYLYATNTSDMGYRYTPDVTGGGWTNLQNNNYAYEQVDFKRSNDNWKYFGQVNSIEDCRLKAVEDKTTEYSSIVYTTGNGVNDKTCYGGVKNGSTNSYTVDGVITSIPPNGSSRLGGTKGAELLKQMKDIQDEIYELMREQKRNIRKIKKTGNEIQNERYETNTELDNIVIKLKEDRNEINRLLKEPDESSNNDDSSNRQSSNYIIYILWISIVIISVILAVHLYYTDSEGISPITYVFVGAWCLIFISYYYRQAVIYGASGWDYLSDSLTNNV